MLLFMNHCNDFAPCGPSIGQYNSYYITQYNIFLPLTTEYLLILILVPVMFPQFPITLGRFHINTFLIKRSFYQ